MEEDPGFGFSQRRFDWNSSNWSKLNFQLKLGNPNMGLPLSNTTHATISTDGLLPPNGFPGLTHPQLDQCGERLGWSYGLPHFRQACSPAIRNISLKDGLSADPARICVNPGGKPYGGADVSGSRKFFVFDRSGDQATLIFYPETYRVPVPPIPMATPKQLGITVSGGEGKAGKTAYNGQDENEDIDVHSEMHEDTEELNALLYSDEESDYSCKGDEDDDEVTSTGHSPSTMTGHWDNGIGPSRKVHEEVASSLWPPSKKRKLSKECLNLPPAADSYEAENPIVNFNNDDAISSSGNCKTISQNRGIKRARIRETISILESLVPGVKGKNPAEVLDEAIEYLKSLKERASRVPSQGQP